MNDSISGQLTYIFWISVLDAALLSWIALRWYGRSMRRLMDQGTPGSAADEPAPVPEPAPVRVETGPPPMPLDFAFFAPDMTGAPRPAETVDPRPTIRRMVIGYCLGAAIFSGVVTALSLGSQSPTPIPVVWISRWWQSAWPIVPTLMAVLALDRLASVRLTLTYLASGSVLVMLVTLGGQIARGTFNTAPLTNVYWFIAGLALEASIPLALLLVSGMRRIRAVLPLALATTLVSGFALVLFRHALITGFNFSPVRNAVLGLAVRTSQPASYYGLFFVAALPVGWMAWRGLRWLAASYGRQTVQRRAAAGRLLVAASSRRIRRPRPSRSDRAGAASSPSWVPSLPIG